MLAVCVVAQASEPPPLHESGAGRSDTCPRLLAERPLAHETGSAGIMKNLAETEDSIKAIATRLLEEALDGQKPSQQSGCDANCPDQGVAEVIYRVRPSALLPENEQNELCLTLEKTTAKTPLRYAPSPFATFDALNEWLSRFTQGQGEDGEQLYEICAANCSPRYTFVIAQQSPGYAVQAEVLCGLARDRAVDTYEISTATRHRCAAP